MASIDLPIKRLSFSRRCCIFKCPTVDPRHPKRKLSLQDIPVSERIRVYSEQNIFIPARSVACPSHFDQSGCFTENKWTKIESVVESDVSSVTALEIMQLLNGMRETLKRSQDHKTYYETLDDDVLKIHIGRLREEFQSLKELSELLSFTLGV